MHASDTSKFGIFQQIPDEQKKLTTIVVYEFREKLCERIDELYIASSNKWFVVRVLILITHADSHTFVFSLLGHAKSYIFCNTLRRGCNLWLKTY